MVCCISCIVQMVHDDIKLQGDILLIVSHGIRSSVGFRGKSSCYWRRSCVIFEGKKLSNNVRGQTMQLQLVSFSEPSCLFTILNLEYPSLCFS